MLERPPAGETYAMGYADILLELLRRRSARKNAVHLLPLLQPGMNVLDPGSGPGSITLGLARPCTPGPSPGWTRTPGRQRWRGSEPRPAGSRKTPKRRP